MTMQYEDDPATVRLLALPPVIFGIASMPPCTNLPIHW